LVELLMPKALKRSCSGNVPFDRLQSAIAADLPAAEYLSLFEDFTAMLVCMVFAVYSMLEPTGAPPEFPEFRWRTCVCFQSYGQSLVCLEIVVCLMRVPPEFQWVGNSGVF
jgi:hypothetical protein